MSGFDPATLDFYATEAPVYAASGPASIARHLPEFLDRLPSGSRILELGCGGGRDVFHMLARGFDVDPTYGTVEIAAQAAVRIGRPVRVMRFDELDCITEYDAVVASASLLHVPRADLPSIVQKIWTSLKPDGWHIASFKGGGLEGRDSFGRYFNYFEAYELRLIYTNACHWDELHIQSGISGGYDGKQGPWHTITVHKAALS